MLMIGGAACLGSTTIPAPFESRYNDTAFAGFMFRQMLVAHGYAERSGNVDSADKVAGPYSPSDRHVLLRYDPAQTTLLAHYAGGSPLAALG